MSAMRHPLGVALERELLWFNAMIIAPILISS